MNKIVAITGLRGSGKTTAARILESKLNFAHFNFADPLRQIAKTAYHLTDDEMNDSVLKETVIDRWPHKSPRQILQYIGTDMFRAWVPDTWTTGWMMRVADELANKSLYDGVVCSDCRFINEAEAVKSMGGMIIRVVRPDLKTADSASLHASETEMISIRADWTINNVGSVDDLQKATLDAVARLF